MADKESQTVTGNSLNLDWSIPDPDVDDLGLDWGVNLSRTPTVYSYQNLDYDDRTSQIRALNEEKLRIKHEENAENRIAEIDRNLAQLAVPAYQELSFYDMVQADHNQVQPAYAPWEIFLGLGTGATVAKLGTAPLKGVLTRAGIIGGIATGTDIPIEIIAEQFENPWLALGISLGLSIPIGGFVDAVIEEKTFRLINRASPKFFSNNLESLLNSKNISQSAKNIVKDLFEKADSGDYISIKEAQDVLRKEMYMDREPDFELSDYHIIKDIAETPTRKEINKNFLKKSYLDFTDEDLQSIQDLSRIESFRDLNREFTDLKRKVNNRLSNEIYMNHPVKELSRDIIREGGFDKEVIEKFIGKQATNDLEKKFPGIVSSPYQAVKSPQRVKSVAVRVDPKKIKLAEKEESDFPVGFPKDMQTKDVLDFWKAHGIAGGARRNFVEIYKIRHQLGWSREKFDKVIDELALKDIIVLHSGKPQGTTKKQFADSFKDEYGDTYFSLTWRKKIKLSGVGLKKDFREGISHYDALQKFPEDVQIAIAQGRLKAEDGFFVAAEADVLGEQAEFMTRLEVQKALGLPTNVDYDATDLINQLIEYKIDQKFVNPIHKAVSNEYTTVQEMLYDMVQMPTLNSIKKSTNRQLKNDWDILYIDELASRMGSKELKFWKIVGAKKLIDRLQKEQREKLTKEGIAPKTIREIENDIAYIRTTATKVISAIKSVRKVDERVAKVLKAEVLQESLKQKREIIKLDGKIKTQLTSVSVPDEYREQLLKFVQPYYQTRHFIEPLENMVDFIDRKIAEYVPGMKIIKQEYNDVLLLPVTISDKKAITLDQYRKLTSFITDMVRIGRQERKINIDLCHKFVDDFNREVAETADKTFKRAKELPSQREEFANQPGKLRSLKDYPTDLYYKFMASLKRPEFIIREISGFDDFGPAQRLFETTKLMEESRYGLTKVLVNRWEDIITKYAQSMGVKRLNSKFWKQRFKDSKSDIAMNREQMLVVAANSGNKHNATAAANSLGTSRLAIRRFLRENMTEQDWNFVKDIWAMTDDMYGMLAQVYRRMTGRTLPKVKNYFPIIPKDKKSIKENIEDIFVNFPGQQYIPKKVSDRFLRTRVGKTDVIHLDFDAFAKHLRDVSHTVTHWEGTTDIYKIIKDDKFKDTVTANLGESKYNVLKQWIEDIIQPSPTDAPTLQKLRANVTLANLGLKVTAAIVQPLSLISAIPEVGARNLISSLAGMTKHPIETVQSINKVSNQMASRSSSWMRDLNEVTDVMNRKGFKFASPAIRDGFFSLIRVGDIIGAYTTWYAGYMKGMNQFDGDIDMAIRVADKAVRTTQPQSPLKDLPNIMKGPEWQRLLTMFYSYYSVLHNQAAEVFQKFRYGHMSFTETLSALHWMYIAPPVVASVMKERRFTKEDMRNYAISHMAGGIPVVRDMISSYIMGYDYIGSPVVDFPIQAVRSMTKLGQYIQDTEGEKEWGLTDMTPFVKTTGYLFGLPTSQFMTMVRGGHAALNDEDVNILDILIKKPREREE